MHVPKRVRTVALLLFLMATAPCALATDASLYMFRVPNTVYLGHDITLRYRLNPGSYDIGEIRWPLQFTFSNGNLIGPVVEGENFSFPSAVARRFEHLDFDSAYGAVVTDPDTLDLHVVAGDSTGWLSGTFNLASFDFRPPDTGWYRFDSVGLPSGDGMILRDLDGQDIPFTWQAGSTYVAPPEVTLTASATYFGDTLIAGLPGQISFHASGTGIDLTELIFAYEYHFSNGNIIGPVSEVTSVAPGAGTALFDTAIWYAQFDGATDPDTSVYQLLSSSGAYIWSNIPVWSLNFTPLDTGTITIDAVTLLTGESLRAVDTAGQAVTLHWSPITIYVIQDSRPVIHVSTNTGTDTLHVGQPSSLVFSLDATGWNVGYATILMSYVFSNGNLIGPVGSPYNPSQAAYLYSDYAISVFEWRYLSGGAGFTGDSGSLAWVAYDQDGMGWDSADVLARIDFTPTDTGLITIDTTSWANFAKQDYQEIPYRWILPFEAVVVGTPDPVVVYFDAFCPFYDRITYEGGAVALQASASVRAGSLVSFDLVQILQDGVPATPLRPPVLRGMNRRDVPLADSLIMFWAPAVGEAGNWTFQFEGRNTFGDVDANAITFQILPPDPDQMCWQSALVEFRPELGPFDYQMKMDFVTSDNTQGVVAPMYVRSLTGQAGLNRGIGTADAGFSSDMAPFEQMSPQNPVYTYDGVLDSVLMGLIDFGGTDLEPGEYPAAYFMNTELRPEEGLIEIDTTFLPPAGQATFNQTMTPTKVPSYSPACFAVAIARNEPPVVFCPLDAAGPVVFGHTAIISGFSYEDPDNWPGPYTFVVASMTKDGLPAIPTFAPEFDGDTFIWHTSDADTADVGLWEFCVRVNDGQDDSENDCCFTVEVINQVPLICFDIGVSEAPRGTDLCVPLSISNLAGATDGSCKELGGFDLLFTYDPTIVTFTGLNLDGSVLDLAGWEYLTYRIEGMNPPLVRIVAIADMNNSNQHPSEFCINGLLANLCFRTTTDLDLGCMSAPVRFYWNDCGDNTASSRDGNILYQITDPYGEVPWYGGAPLANPPVAGGGIIENSDSISYQLATFGGGTTGPAEYPCVQADSSKPSPQSFLYFVNGKIKITCPGDLDDRGDINLNGLAYEISDAVLYSNYFIQGPSVFVVNVAGQTAASDVNADGTPLTVADLVYLIRVITGDAEPIAEDLLGGGPKVAAVVGAINVTSVQQGANVSVSVNSEFDMGAGLFVYKTGGREITGVQAVGQASAMDVKYEAANGELRILVYNIEDRTKVSAGNGEILNIATHGVGTVELISVEAATFMGGTLDATLEARVLPTAYALHQNFPNPFNPSTSMAIDFPNAAEYTLTIYNIAGQVVKTYAGLAGAGTHTITWDGRDNRGSVVASGVYFYAFKTTDGFSDVRKMLLMK